MFGVPDVARFRLSCTWGTTQYDGSSEAVVTSSVRVSPEKEKQT